MTKSQKCPCDPDPFNYVLLGTITTFCDNVSFHGYFITLIGVCYYSDYQIIISQEIIM